LVTSSGGYFGAAWAPDGAHFFNGQEPTPIEVRNASGSLLTSYAQFDRAYWLDPSHLLGYRDTVGDPETAVASIADLKGSVVAAPEALNTTDGDGLPNGFGAVAVARKDASASVATYTFSVWSSGGVSAPHDGYPMAWSADGTKLAVVHFIKWGMKDFSGSLEVVSWPGLDRLYAGPRASFDEYSIEFDPSDQFVSLADYSNDSRSLDSSTRVVSIGSGATADIPCTIPCTTFWNDHQQLSFDTRGQLETYDTLGKLVDERLVGGFLANASPDGSTVAFISDSIGSIVIERNGSVISQSQFGAGGISQPWFSPDGRSLLLYAYLPDGSTGLFLKRL
jgi:hypothetical protein